LYCQVEFPAHATHTVTVNYEQYLYADSREPSTYQLAYVLHPASLWKEFGPITLTLELPQGIKCRASVPTEPAGRDRQRLPDGTAVSAPLSVFKAVLKTPAQKKGELYIALDKAAWDHSYSPAKPEPER
jgi:hypothetical protein